MLFLIMKYQKYISILTILILFGYGYANAQSSSSSDGADNRVTLNIILYPIQSIMVNPVQNVVDLEYKSKEDYMSGVENTQKDHLTVYSTGGFDVNVHSSDEHLVGANKKIPVADVRLTASKGSNNDLSDVQYNSSVPLSTGPANLLTSKSGGVGQTFSISYESAGDDSYVNHYDADDNPTVFTTVLTYSIVSK